MYYTTRIGGSTPLKGLGRDEFRGPMTRGSVLVATASRGKRVAVRNALSWVAGIVYWGSLSWQTFRKAPRACNGAACQYGKEEGSGDRNSCPTVSESGSHGLGLFLILLMVKSY